MNDNESIELLLWRIMLDVCGSFSLLVIMYGRFQDPGNWPACLGFDSE